jgi:hypothetical protein
MSDLSFRGQIELENTDIDTESISKYSAKKVNKKIKFVPY